MISTPRCDDLIDGDKEDEKPLRALSRIAARAHLFRSADGRLFAHVPVGNRHEIYGLRSLGFRDWLIESYVVEHPLPPPAPAVRGVISMLEARARFQPEVPRVFVRVGRGAEGGRQGDGAVYWLDLGDSSGRAIEINPHRWLVVDEPAVRFRRPSGHLPMPTPVRPGSIDLLRPFVNVVDADFPLLVAWMTAALRPVGPYPILVLHGEQGSAKSTLAKVLRLLIDPQACPVLAPPASTRDLLATAVNGWLLAYDNISTIPVWLSDAFCQLAFGGGFAGRALFTNDERSVIHAERPLLLGGIDDFVRRSDLRDRCIFLNLPPIPSARRRDEAEYWDAFHAAYPRILGAVLDLVVGGLRQLPSVHLRELPRMADYAKWGEAVARGQGMQAGAFLASYTGNRRTATEAELETTPLGTLMMRLARMAMQWTGTVSRLHTALTETVDVKIATSATWPKSPRELSNELRRIAPQLRLHGMNLKFTKSHGERIITITHEASDAETCAD